MRKELLELLRGRCGDELKVVIYEESNAHIIEGSLHEPDGYWYPIQNGVPNLLRGGLRSEQELFREKHNLGVLPDAQFTDHEKNQSLTNNTFSDKWRRFKNYGMLNTHKEFLFDWYCKKLGMTDINELKEFYNKKQCVLEVGPGSGFNSRFMAEQVNGTVIALDISDAAYTTFENTNSLKNCHAVQGDLMDVPFENDFFDFIIADGVLHHTPSTKDAVFSLYNKLKPGGQFFFYVYREMGAMRKYCDDFVREAYTKLPAEDCYKACEGFTELGRELSKLNVNVTLEKGIPELGIPAGEHDVQRLFYYNFIKCFWNDAFDWETNNMVNFDWYHPHNAWQHSEEEVVEWLNELNVTDYKFNNSNPNGISVLLTKSKAV